MECEDTVVKPQISDTPIQHLLWAHSMHSILGKDALELPAYSHITAAEARYQSMLEGERRDLALEKEVDELHAKGEL